MSKKYRNKKISEEKEVSPGVWEAEYVREEVPVEEAEEAAPKVDFDVWHTLRKGRIPRQHHKEILKADFEARGLGQEESMADYDAALGKYGVKLS